MRDWTTTFAVANYALVSALWLAILVLYVRAYRAARATDPIVAVLAGVLALDAFKSVFENVYFGVLWTGRYGVAFEEATEWLSRPLPLLLPKLINLIVALIILLTITRRWIPDELRAHRQWLEGQARLQRELRRSLTEVHAQEERWHLAMMATDAGTLDYDVATGELWTSDRLHEQLGCSREEAHARTMAEWSAAVHDEDRDEIRLLVEGLLSGASTAATAEPRVRACDGTYRRLLARAVARTGGDGRPTRIVCSLSDVTELRDAEGALTARERVESLGMLAGGVAHDFNNLLAAIRGNAALARREVTTPAATTALANIEDVVARATELTSRLLAYSGRGRFVVKPVDLAAFAREMARLLGSGVRPGVRVVTETSERVPTVEGDPAQLQQVFVNLFTNAVDALGGEPGTITVRTRRERVEAPLPSAVLGEDPVRPGDHVVLEVEDTGVGMDATTLQRIFQPFYTQKGPGRGMGLSAMLGILRAHRAGMQIRSTPGVGSTFTLYFASSPESSAQPSIPPSSGPRSPRPARHALVADDDPALQSLFRQLLESEGYDVVVARTGREAVAELDRVRFSIAVLDVTMPEMTGPEVVAALRARPEAWARTIPVLLVSGYAAEGTTLDEHTAFLSKPFDVDDLHDALVKLVDRR